jgi:hypothetical protein
LQESRQNVGISLLKVAGYKLQVASCKLQVASLPSNNILHMKTNVLTFILAGLIILASFCNRPAPTISQSFDPEQEEIIVEQVIHNAICWAMTKDTATLFNTFIPDSTLFIFSPDSASTSTGFQSIKDLAENVWMTDHFKALECNIKNLRISFSKGGDVAWYSCYLDDISEWDGRRSGWVNVRWTGVLEKREGKWLIMQMHFSFPVERFR